MRELIAEEKQYYEDLMKSMHDEKAVFEEGLRDKYIALDQDYNDALNNLHEKERYNQAVVRDHLELKHVFELEERASQEENEVLRQDNLNVRNQIRRMCSETNKTVKGAKNDYEMNAEEFSRRFRE